MFGLVGGEEDGHAVVDGADELVGGGGEDGEGFERAVGRVPAVPQAGQAEAVAIGLDKLPRDFAAALALPFEKGVGRDEAATLAERIAEGRFFRNGFRPGVDALGADFGILGPVRDQAPAELGDFEVGRSSADNGGAVGGPDDGLRGGGDEHLSLADLYLFVFSGVFRAHGLLVWSYK